MGQTNRQAQLTEAEQCLQDTLEALSASAAYAKHKISTDLESGKYDSKFTSHACYLAEHAVQVVRELRQLEAHEKKMGEQMTEQEKAQLIKGYFEDLGAIGRAKWVKLLKGMDTEESLLA